MSLPRHFGLQSSSFQGLTWDDFRQGLVKIEIRTMLVVDCCFFPKISFGGGGGGGREGGGSISYLCSHQAAS